MGFYEDYIKRTPDSQKAAERAQPIITGGMVIVSLLTQKNHPPKPLVSIDGRITGT